MGVAVRGVEGVAVGVAVGGPVGAVEGVEGRRTPHMPYI